MSRFGEVRKTSMSAAEFRVACFMSVMGRINFGNCGVPSDLQVFFFDNTSLIEDVFQFDDVLYILPKTHEAAALLYNLCVGVEDSDKHPPLADEIDWAGIEGRYWLRLWWD